MTNSEYNKERAHLKQKFDKKFILSEKKVIIATAILSILVVISVFNRNTFSHKGQIDMASQGEGRARQIASVPLGTTNSEDSLAKELSLRPLDDKAKWGQNPSRVEQLTFGLLEGKYSVRLKDGKLNGFELSNEGSQPKMVQNLERFISENKEILPVKFDSISQVQSSKSEFDFVQKFTLMSAASRRLAEVEFHLDNLGRLLSMKINKNL